MPNFPNSAVSYEFLGAAPSRHYSPIYYHASGDAVAGQNMASVNAGDPGLYVRGGTINAQFGKETPNAPAYDSLHAAALTEARKVGFGKIASLHSFPQTPAAPVSVILSSLGDVDSGSGAPADGTVFLDVFTPADRPHGVTENYAMAYVIPPYGGHFQDDASFLGAISRASARIIAVVAHYNAALRGDLSGLGLGPIGKLRMCLFSGGQFIRPSLVPADVAKANFTGICNGLTAGPSGIDVVEFENGQGEFSSLPQT
jgi:hypothetical protein